MAHVPPNILRCAASFCSASRLLPDPQLEHVPSRFNLQTSQLIPQVPVGIVSPHTHLVVLDIILQVLFGWQVLHPFNWFNSFDWFDFKPTNSTNETNKTNLTTPLTLNLRNLTLGTYMRTALADYDSLNFRLASRTGVVGAAKYVQLVAVTSLMLGDGIKVGFAGPQ